MQVPAIGAVGDALLASRFRLSSQSVNAPVGLASDGEVEDYSIQVTAKNQLPTIGLTGPLVLNEDDGAKPFILTGVTAGANELQALQIFATSNNPNLFQVDSIETSDAPGLASLVLSAMPNAFGSGTVTITVRDAGPDGFPGNADDGISTATMTVNVLAVNDAPTGFADTLSIRLPENAGVQTIELTDLSAGPGEDDSFTLRVTTDMANMFKSLSIVRDEEDPTRARLNFETEVNQRGAAQIFVTIDDGSLTYTQTIELQVDERNDPPAVNTVPEVKVAGGTRSTTVSLTGITAGPSENQQLKISAWANREPTESIFESMSVVYAESASTAAVNLRLKSGISGTEQFLVVMRDAGSDGVFDTSDDAVSSQPVFVTVEATASNPWQNPAEPLDVNADGFITPLDVLLIINDINTNGARTLPHRDAGAIPYPRH